MTRPGASGTSTPDQVMRPRTAAATSLGRAASHVMAPRGPSSAATEGVRRT
jgi:hypothetical protein